MRHSPLKDLSAPLEGDIKNSAGEVFVFPMSFAQQRLWFLDQFEPNTCVYNIPMAYRLSGVLNVTALAQSLNEIVRRHETLRTTFSVVDEQPVQVISPSLSLSLPIIDLQGLPEPERQIEAQRQMFKEAKRPFDLQHGPLFRAIVWQITSDDMLFLLNMHHIISDAWSFDILFQELSGLYNASIAGSPSPLTALSIQYADFAVWQKELLRGEALDALLNYWKQQLNHVPRLTLPTDHQRLTVPTYRGAHHDLLLPQPLVGKLKKLSQGEGVTSFMTLLAAWGVLLSRYSGQEDMVIGTPIANRTRYETEGLIGFFVNTLVLRIDVTGPPSFRDLLGRVQAVCLDAYTYQDLPFEKLVEELQPERELASHPLFQVVFALQNDFHSSLELMGLTLRSVDIPHETAKFDLALGLNEHENGLLAVLEYTTDLFEARTIKRMLIHYHTLLESIVEHPDVAVTELSLLTDAERYQLLVGWNDTQADYPRNVCIHHLFEGQVKRSPDAVAVVFEDQQLTYQALNSKANQLAHSLQQHGVGPEVLVGICVERSIEIIIGILGILKAGGAYVPLDPTYPKKRLAYMVEDTQARVVLTQESLRGSLVELDVEVLVLDSNWHVIARRSDKNPSREVTAEHLAYVMYTSGSTGKPKGVSVVHRNVVRLVKETDYVEIVPEDVFLLFAPLAFDASTFEMWACLLNGARLVIAPPHLPSLEEFGVMLQTYRVTTLWLTAGVFHHMVDRNLTSLSALRQLLAGGDVLSVPHVQKVLRKLCDGRLINGYGPTEGTTFTCCHPMTVPDQVGVSVPIGRPIANTHVYVLDHYLSPVPPGVPGELYIGGDGVARGYLNDPDLTAEKFLPDPFRDAVGARIYKTGDMARYLPDGTIEFLGRLDHQVKIRGFRIELGEIESILGQHPLVHTVVVLAREDAFYNKRLVAYVVAIQRSAPSIDELRRFLQQRLPDYMIPSVLMFLDTLPLTPNGKVDRKALPVPDQNRPDLETSFMAPRTPIEEIIAGIWANVLDVKQVGIYDNFFALGGHSLLAMQVISRMRDALKMEIPLRRIFETPTVAGLAGGIASFQQLKPQSSPIATVSRDTSVPLSFAQQRLWFLDLLDPGQSVYNIPVAYHFSGPLNVSALEQSLHKIVQRHEVLRTRFPVENGQPFQEITSDVEMTLPVRDIRHIPESERMRVVQRQVNEDAQRPFDLVHGPLFRTILWQLDKEEYILLLVIHHIVTDGWSMNILFHELSTFYKAFSAGKRSPLPNLPIQYADFTIWQREWLRGELLDTHLNYWKRHLHDAPILALPTDHQRLAVPTYRGGHHSLQLPQALVGKLKQLSQREGATLFMTLLAAWGLLLSRYSGQKDIVIGSPIAHRHHSEIEPLIGFFVNTLVLRIDLFGNPTCRTLLKQVREICLNAYAHQDLPFEKLVEELQPERDPAYHPLFQVGFALQHASHSSLELTGLEISHVALPDETAKFDLALTLDENSDGLLAVLGYAADLFEAGTIKRMLAHYRTVLEGLVDTPDVPVTEIALLTPAEQQQILQDWNATEIQYPQGLLVHHLVEKQAKQCPEAIALVFGEQRFTYRELNLKANQLAHFLKKLGVKPDVLVGLYLERSPDLVIGVLGILKAGGAYVPLDPEYPLERLTFMLEDTQIAILLTQERFVATLPEYQSELICLDRDWGEIRHECDESPLAELTSEHLAYIIYTSGSTGRPKGVLIAHRGLRNLIISLIQTFHLHPGSRVLHLVSISFDAATAHLFMTLCSGATLYLTAKDELFLESGLIRILRDQQITHTNLPVSMLAALPVVDLPVLQTIVVGAEACTVELAARWAKGRQLFDAYGPTETTIGSTIAEYREGDQKITIGHPLANTQIYILDEQLQPLPVGIPGELYIGGVGLARGYLHAPDQTAEKFIPNPFSEQPGERLYKTGDLASYLPDGNIEFLGRLDHQVKIRGFRIELGEIEAALRQHQAVKETVVTVHEDRSHGKQLIAYIVSARQSPLTTDDLRHFLKQQLPDYMIPSLFMFLDALPLTRSGKVDRKALPEPEQIRLNPVDDFAEPQTSIERLIAEIWQELLGVDRVGAYDNFFDLGGHSLLSIQAIAQLEKRIGITLSPRDLMFQTLGQIASLCEKKTSLLQKTRSKNVPRKIWKTIQNLVLQRNRK